MSRARVLVLALLVVAEIALAAPLARVVTPPIELEVWPAWIVGLRARDRVVIAGAKGDDAVAGVVIDRRGRVVCAIRSYQRTDGCVVLEICDRQTIRCTR
jgi:hypothetical protein